MDWYIAAGFGALGGLLRALLGVKKALGEGNFKIRWAESVTTLLIAACTGIITMLVPGSSSWLAFSTGYLGDDAIKGLMPAPSK